MPHTCSKCGDELDVKLAACPACNHSVASEENLFKKAFKKKSIRTIFLTVTPILVTLFGLIFNFDIILDIVSAATFIFCIPFVFIIFISSICDIFKRPSLAHFMAPLGHAAALLILILLIMGIEGRSV